MSGPGPSIVERLEATLARGRDGAPLRFGLASALAQAGRLEEAIVHLERALELEPGYAAAWKLLGQSLVRLGRAGEAVEAYRAGIEAAHRAGHVQAAREMEVFLRRLERQGTGGAGSGAPEGR